MAFAFPVLETGFINSYILLFLQIEINSSTIQEGPSGSSLMHQLVPHEPREGPSGSKLSQQLVYYKPIEGTTEQQFNKQDSNTSRGDFQGPASPTSWFPMNQEGPLGSIPMNQEGPLGSSPMNQWRDPQGQTSASHWFSINQQMDLHGPTLSQPLVLYELMEGPTWSNPKPIKGLTVFHSPWSMDTRTMG